MAQTYHDTTGLERTFPFPTLRLEKTLLLETKRSGWKKHFLGWKKTLGLETKRSGWKKHFLGWKKRSGWKTVGLEKKKKRLRLGITRSGSKVGKNVLGWKHRQTKKKRRKTRETKNMKVESTLNWAIPNTLSTPVHQGPKINFSQKENREKKKRSEEGKTKKRK